MSAKETKPVTQRQLRRYRNGAVVGFVILLVGIGVSDRARQSDTRAKSDKADHGIVQSGRYVSVVGCNRDFGTIKQLRVLISRSSGSLVKFEKEGTLTHAQVQRGLAENQRALADLKLPDCSAARTAITDDPKNIPPVPVPLTPGKDG